MLLLDLLHSYFYTYQIQIQMEWIVSSPWAAYALKCYKETRVKLYHYIFSKM